MFTCTCNFFMIVFTITFVLIINTLYYQIIKSNRLNETLPRIWENSNILNCDCNMEGSVFVECSNSKVNCFCKTNVTGMKCANCHPGFYGFPDCKGKTNFNFLNSTTNYII